MFKDMIGGQILLYTHNGHGKSGWSPIGCSGFHTNLDVPRRPKSTPYYFTLVFR